MVPTHWPHGQLDGLSNIQATIYALAPREAEKRAIAADSSLIGIRIAAVARWPEQRQWENHQDGLGGPIGTKMPSR